MMRRADFERDHPGVIYLDIAEPDRLVDYLRGTGVLAKGETVVGVERAGEGNMNCTLRVRTTLRGVVVKQSRPWVEKYPQFPAPWDRALREIEFYQRIAHDPFVSRAMPELLWADREARLLILEDIEPGQDYTGIYGDEVLDDLTLRALADFLSALHSLLLREPITPALANREMRALNRAHIFVIPLEPDGGLDLDRLVPGLDLDRLVPGLEEAADELRGDAAFAARVARLGNEVYLADGTILVHGDFFPGSFLQSPRGPRIIDPEFSYAGRPEFDVGVLLAHLLLGRQPETHPGIVLEAYRPPSRFDESVALQLAGVEVMRRLIGYAQLPLAYGLEERRALLQMSRRLVLEPTREGLKRR